MPAKQTIEIRPAGPFRLDLTAWVLRRRGHNQIDFWDSNSASYRRSLVLDDTPSVLVVSQSGEPDAAVLQVTVSGAIAGTHALEEARSALTRILGLNLDMSGFEQMAASDPDIGSIASRMGGVRPPRLPSVFEALVNGAACQQLSLEVGIHLLNRITTKFGLPIEGASGGEPAFPGPEELASVDPEEIKQLGFSFSKARTIVEAAQTIVTGDLDLEGTEYLDDSDAFEALTSLWGIGRWTAEYVMLRGLGRVHIFPGDDIGAHNRLRQLLDLDGELAYERVQDLVSRWSPYAGLVYFHLLLDSLARDGVIKP
ncbi:MAG: DNA-3-methyladenine glycosylase 2 family protein [Thermoleophilia bacterium]|nr:DNA-3-methyladenine glycosylase 2 family protein [Thermoleophilia bacterium]